MSNSGGQTHFDLLVLGGGSGGLAAARESRGLWSQSSACRRGPSWWHLRYSRLHPQKLMVYASELKKVETLAPGYGFLEANLGAHNWGELKRRRDNVVKSLESMHERYLDQHNVTLIRGRGSLSASGGVTVGDTSYEASHILIATGSTPRLPRFDGAAHVATSDALWELQERPEHVVIIGGGYIAVEYASLLAGLGTKVTLLVRSNVLRSFDIGIQTWSKTHLEQRGVTLVEGATIESVSESKPKCFSVSFKHEGETKHVTSDLALFGTLGRTPNTSGLGLERQSVQVDPNHGGIVVNDQHETSQAGIFAVGDVLGRAQLTPLAIRAGRSLADRLFDQRDVAVNYDLIPTAVFTTPPIGTVGLSESEAFDRFGDLAEVFETHFGGLKYSFTSKEETPRTFMKLIRHRETDQVLGVHIAGDDAAEMIQGFAVALTAGATKSQFDETLAIHPTSAEELVLLKEGRPAAAP